MFEFFKKKIIKEPENNVVGISKSDNLLKTYKEKAQKEIQYLIDFIQSHEKNDKLFRYAVKANFMQDDKSEHMWVQVNEFKNGFFIGVLANHPETIKSIKYGDALNVFQEDVEDWLLQDYLTNTKVGGFSSGYIKNKAN